MVIRRLASFAIILALIGAAIFYVDAQGNGDRNAKKQVDAIVTGWHDEFKRGATGSWTWSAPQGHAICPFPDLVACV